jgi:hypothetical protein
MYTQEWALCQESKIINISEKSFREYFPCQKRVGNVCFIKIISLIDNIWRFEIVKT